MAPSNSTGCCGCSAEPIRIPINMNSQSEIMKVSGQVKNKCLNNDTRRTTELAASLGVAELARAPWLCDCRAACRAVWTTDRLLKEWDVPLAECCSCLGLGLMVRCSCAGWDGAGGVGVVCAEPLGTRPTPLPSSSSLAKFDAFNNIVGPALRPRTLTWTCGGAVDEKFRVRIMPA